VMRLNTHPCPKNPNLCVSQSAFRLTRRGEALRLKNGSWQLAQ
jgi:hypothetical protein